jgi:large repetitive protein
LTDADLLVVTKYEIGGIVYLPGTTTDLNNIGTFEVYANGRFTFIPELNYSGDVPAISYTVSDVNGGTATANLFIRVTSGNHAPVVTASPVTTKINKPVTGAVTATDVDGDALTFTKSADPAHGVVIVNLDGTFTYTPSLGFIGPDSFKMIVSDGKGGDIIVILLISVEGYPNSLPVALDDKFEFTENSGSGNGNVLANDTDTDGNVLLVTQFVVSKETYLPGSTGNLAGVGTITINAEGSFVFIPVDNYVGNVQGNRF